MLYCNWQVGIAGGLRLLTYAAFAPALFFSVPALLCASEATSDVAGSRDFDLIKRFPHSHIVRYEQATETLPYRLILGPLIKVNNILSPKKSRHIEGKLTRITYRIPDGNRSDEVSDYFNRNLADNKIEVIFHCRGRDCGSSNYWANTIFKRAVLYGPEQFQNFFVARFNRASGTTFVSVYTAQRGNRRLYAHLDIIESAQTEVEMDPQIVLNSLLDQGMYLMAGVDFSLDHHLTPASAKVIAIAATALNMDESFNVYVVGHLQGSDGLKSLVDHSRQRAQQVVTMLIEEGVKTTRISAQGVGPLAPVHGSVGPDNSTGGRIELVLVR